MKYLSIRIKVNVIIAVVAGLLGCIALPGCEKDVTVDLPTPQEQIVVEGYIESGGSPYVILSRNAPYFGGFDLNDLSSYIVKGANVWVWDKTDTVQLVDTCLSDFPAEIQQLIANQLGFSVMQGDEVPDICVYVEKDMLHPKMIGKPGKTYHLRVDVEGKILTAKTLIPYLTPLDSVWYRLNEQPKDSSLVRLIIQINDPDTLGNYVRYFTKRNKENFIPGLNSVFDDFFVNGKKFHIPIDRGQERNQSIDLDTYGYFWKGDTVTIRWSAIDKAHYDFWSTLEQEMNSSGPFSTPTVVKTNINGGLGIWGGYGISDYTIILPK